MTQRSLPRHVSPRTARPRVTSLTRRAAVLACCATAVAMLLPAQAGAQSFPTKPVKIVVAYAAGGTIDNAGRRIAEDLGTELGQPVIIENRGGANGIPASEYVARAAPDGHTMLLTSVPAHAGNKAAYKKLPYDTINDFIPVTVLSYQPLVLVAHPSLPANNIPELIKLAKERPGKISYASFGVGGLAHLAGVQLNLLGGSEMNHVPYKGGGPAIADVLGGHVDLYFSGVTTVLPLIAEGKLKALAVSSAKRVKSLPNVPTVAETPGFGSFEAVVPPILMVPAKTPAAVVARLHAALYKVTHNEAHRAKIEKAGEGDVLTSTPEQSMEMLKKEVDRLALLFKAAGIEPE